MNISEPNNPPKDMHRLTLSESRGALVVPLATGCLLAALSVAALVQGQKIGAGAFGLTALMQFITLPALFKRHRQVKQGGAIYVALNAHPMRMPQIVSIIVVLMATAFVGVCSAFIVYVVRQYFNTQVGWTVCGVTLLAVWVFIGYCWYRVAAEKPMLKPEVYQEQTEGVWPPSPVMTTERNNP